MTDESSRLAWDFWSKTAKAGYIEAYQTGKAYFTYPATKDHVPVI